MSTKWAFDNIENKHTLYRGKDCMKKLTDFEKKKMLSLTKEELKTHQDAKVYYIYGKNLKKSL